MNRSIKLIAVAVPVLFFSFVTSGLAQQSGQAKPPARQEVPKSPQSDLEARSPGTAPPVAFQPAISSRPGTLIIPKSSIPEVPAAGQTGLNLTAHTNIQVYLPSGVSPQEAPPFAGYGYETPASIACHYNLVTTSASPACNPNVTTVNPTGGGQTIAIVDAFDDPNAPGDLAWFSLQFGIPLELSQFHVVWATTSSSSCAAVPPDFTGGWELEESLDIEWAHAMAPGANLYLVEACSNSYNDLLQAVSVATNLVQCGQTEIGAGTGGTLGTCPSITGFGMVSMSWGGGEFSGETSLDTYFNQTDVQYFASSGDSPGVLWPCSSVNVICAGGTTIRRNNGTNGLPLFNFESEAAWVFGGGGISSYESLPSYQSGVTHCTAVSTTRCVPDVSFDADPYTGVYVYDTFGVDFISSGEWWIVGGTSVASPSLTGIWNAAQAGGTGSPATGFPSSSSSELTYMYGFRANASDYTVVPNGFCGFYMGTTPFTGGYSLCNGIGVDNGYSGK
jgi:subtilase family serine protease